MRKLALDIQRLEKSLLIDSVPSPSAGSLHLEAYRLYAALKQAAATTPANESEPSLGGILLYVGELDAHGSAMVIAGNVAGCATLAVTAESASQKQAIRDGAVDFVVTSLDEGLRILKNEIRKRSTVAVCVGLAPGDVEREMMERGVVPDLVFAGTPCGFNTHQVQLGPPTPDHAFLEWRVVQAPIRWMAKLDAIALECLQQDRWAQRWIRRSARYFGRSAQGQRVVGCTPDAAMEILKKITAAVESGTIESEVSASLTIGAETTAFHFPPARTN